MIEANEVIIYEIIGRKVGQSRQGIKRPKEQLTEGESYSILQVIPPNTLTVRECWEHEQDWAATLGYPVENESHWLWIKNVVDGTFGRRISVVMNDSEWKEIIGKSSYEKQKTTKNSPEWIETTGKESRIKAVKNTDYEAVSQNLSETINDPEWKETIGKSSYEKQKTTKNSPEWKEKHYRTCEHCGKGPMNLTNYLRWHSDNCRRE